MKECDFMYDIMVYIGYFLILIICLIIAIILGNRPAGWTMYGIGAFIQFLSLVGLYNSYQGYPYFGYGFGEEFAPYIIIYVLLLFVSAVLIALHRPKTKKDTDNITTENNSAYDDPQSIKFAEKRQTTESETEKIDVKKREKEEIRDSLGFFLAIILLPIVIIGIIGLIYIFK